MSDDLEYYARRSQSERKNAEKASDPGVARLHREMAERYEAMTAEKTENPLRQAQ